MNPHDLGYLKFFLQQEIVKKYDAKLGIPEHQNRGSTDF
jgi:hypothetical protein